MSTELIDNINQTCLLLDEIIGGFRRAADEMAERLPKNLDEQQTNEQQIKIQEKLKQTKKLIEETKDLFEVEIIMYQKKLIEAKNICEEKYAQYLITFDNTNLEELKPISAAIETTLKSFMERIEFKKLLITNIIQQFELFKITTELAKA